MTPELKQRIADNRQRYYDALKAHDPQRYFNAIATAEAVTLRHGLSMDAAVDVEAAVLFAVCEAIGLKPEIVQ